MAEKAVMQALRSFVAERDWAQFHSAENLAKSISIESAELLECFQWSPDFDLGDVKAELADVLSYCFLLADKLDLDVGQIILEKLEATEIKYPVDKARGRSAKYDQL